MLLFAPAARVQVGDWRSPNVEQLQLKRNLHLGFAYDEAAGGLVATGDDAALAMIPDQITKITFSKLVFKESGINHGRVCYEAFERPEPPPVAAAAHGLRAWLSNPAVAAGAGVAIGMLALLALQRARG